MATTGDLGGSGDEPRPLVGDGVLRVERVHLGARQGVRQVDHFWRAQVDHFWRAARDLGFEMNGQHGRSAFAMEITTGSGGRRTGMRGGQETREISGSMMGRG